MASRKAKGRAPTKKRAQRATSNVFAMFDQAQISVWKYIIVKCLTFALFFFNITKILVIIHISFSVLVVVYTVLQDNVRVNT